MKRHHLVAGLLALLPPPSGNAADALFIYDHKLAVDLSVVYLKAYFRAWPKAAMPGVDFRHPEVIALRDAKRRKLIFVTFGSTQSAAGATATFQLCDEPPQLRVTEVDTVDPIGSYRESLKEGQGQVFVHLDDVCPPSRE
jgi:hypothetical protein